MFPWFRTRNLLPKDVQEDHVATELQEATMLVQEMFRPASVFDVLAAICSAGFSAKSYYFANPDLQSTFSNPERAILHFLAMQGERRSFPIKLSLQGCAAIKGLATYDRSIIADLLASLVDAAVEMKHEPQLDVLSSLWNSVIALRHFGGHPYLIIGDSHSTFYRRSTLRGAEWLLPLGVCCSGGSAIGLSNLQSRSGYARQLRKLTTFLSRAFHGEQIPILFQFGQVDVEFVHPFRLIRSGSRCFDFSGFRDFCTSSVNGYVATLKTLFPLAARQRVTVVGIFPPALKDGPLNAGYVNGHVAHLEGLDAAVLKKQLAQLDWPNLAQRTELHLLYNLLLEKAAIEAGFGFYSDFGSLLSSAGVLDERFIAFGKGEDHHLDRQPTEQLLSSTIWHLLERENPDTCAKD